MYALLIRLYPRAFRDEWGEEMRVVFADARRFEGASIWLRVVRDLAVSVPARRLEELRMDRSTVGIVVLVAVIVAGVPLLVVGAGSPVAAAAVGAGMLLFMAVVVGVAAIIARSGSAPAEGRYMPRRRWWFVPAGLIAAVEVFSGIGQMVDDPKAENAFAFAVAAAFASLIVFGMRARSRTAGDWMIIAGVLPMLPFIWFVPAPIAALTVIVFALADTIRASRLQRLAS